MIAYVFFSTGKTPFKPVTASRLWARFLSFAIRTGTRSKLSHVLIADGNVRVLDNTFGGPKYRQFGPFMEEYPGLAWYFRVPLEHDPNLDLALTTGPKGSWSVFWWWATGGRTRTKTSCVRVVSDCLRRGGLDVPRLVTPQGLNDWLLAQGFERELLDGTGTKPPRRTD